MGRLLPTGPGRRGLGSLCCLPLLLAPWTAQQKIPTAEAYRGRLCFSTVVADEEPGIGNLLASPEPGEEMFATGDTLFAEITEGSVAPGDGLLAYRSGSDIKHPTTGERIGRSTFLAAYLTVTQVQGVRALVHVEFACAELERGDSLRPLHADDITVPAESPLFDPIQLIEPAAGDATVAFGSSESVLVSNDDSERAHPSDRVSYTVGDVMTLDMGTAAGWTPGTWGIVYAEPAMARRYGESTLIVEPVIVAQGYVLWATASNAAFMVTEAVGGIELGMRARQR